MMFLVEQGAIMNKIGMDVSVVAALTKRSWKSNSFKWENLRQNIIPK
jgi:hypothetical protein